MNHDQFDPLEALDAALQVEPSPDFAARVRIAVAAQHRPSGFRTWWMWGAAATVAVVGGVLLFVRATPNVTPAANTPITQQALTPIVVPAPPAAPGPTPMVRHKPVREASAAVRASSPTALEVLVPADQAQALDRWLAAQRARSSGEPAGDARRPVVIDAIPPIGAIVIDPVKIESLVPAGSGGDREKQR